MQSFKQYLNESRDAVAKFGNVLFGDHRNKNEEDTPYEMDVFNSIADYVQSMIIRPVFPKQLRELMGLKRMYPDVLEPEHDTSVLYRGLNMAFYGNVGLIGEIKKAIKNDSFTHESVHSKIKYFRADINYIPLEKVESWSVDEKVAWKFASARNRASEVPAFIRHVTTTVEKLQKNPKTYKYLDLRDFMDLMISESQHMSNDSANVVMELYKPKKNQLIFNSKFLHSVLKYGSPEKEVIRLDETKSPVKVHIWIPEINYLGLLFRSKFGGRPVPMYEYIRENYDPKLPSVDEIKRLLKQ